MNARRRAAALPPFGDDILEKLPAKVVEWLKSDDVSDDVARSFAKQMGLDPATLMGALDRTEDPTAAARARTHAGNVSASSAARTTPGGLRGDELEGLRRSMGTYRATTPREPHTNHKGEFVLPTNTPTEHRKIMAARAAKGVR